MPKVTRHASNHHLLDQLLEALKNIGRLLRPRELQPARIPESEKPARQKKR